MDGQTLRGARDAAVRRTAANERNLSQKTVFKRITDELCVAGQTGLFQNAASISGNRLGAHVQSRGDCSQAFAPGEST